MLELSLKSVHQAGRGEEDILNRGQRYGDSGEQQGVEWGRGLGKEKGTGQVQAMEGALNGAVKLELCLVGNRDPLKDLGRGMA